MGSKSATDRIDTIKGRDLNQVELAALPSDVEPEPGLGEKYASAEDDAAAILRQHGYIEWTEEEEKRMVRKIDWRVCVPMMIIYTLCHLDKSALAYASVFELKKETNLKGQEYSWLGSIVYLVQLVVQPISAYALVKLPLAKWAIFNVFCWGVAVTCMAACKNFGGLLATRASVGGFEATVSPCFIAVVQLWWRRREQTYRNTYWLLSSSIAGTIGGLVTFGVGHINNKHLLPYQSIFLFLGLITIASVPIMLWAMPDDVATAKFLTDREKAIAVHRLRDNNTGTKTSVWKKEQVREAFLDPKTWMWGLMLALLALPSSGIGTFKGLVTKGFGFNDFQTIGFGIPPEFLHGVFLLAATYISARIKMRFPAVAFSLLFPLAGAITLLCIDRDEKYHMLGAYYVLLQYSCIQPLLYSWANANAAGTTKQRVIGGIMFIFQCAGNVAGPQVYFEREAPIYKTGLIVDLACWTMVLILVLSMAAYLKYLNRRQARRREALGQIGEVRDVSLMTRREAEEYKRQMEGRTQMNQHAFDDMTDFQNPDFQYVL